jgi:hypothetical protein
MALCLKLSAALVALVALLVQLLPKDPSAYPLCNNYISLCVKEPLAATATTSQYGVWRRASPLANVTREPASLLDKLRLKEWNYVSVSTERFFVGAALVKFSYIADVFLYVIDKQNPQLGKLEYTARMPLGIGLDIAPSSLQGCSKWGAPPKKEGVQQNSSPWIQLCAKMEGGWRVRANVPLYSAGQEQQRVPFQMDLEFGASGDDALALVYPLGGDAERRAYTHKGAALVDKGWLRLGGAEADPVAAEGGAAALDWTRSLALHHTRWRWASCSDTTATSSGKTVKHFAINLSQHVYDVQGLDSSKVASAENAVWVNGRVIRLLQPLVIDMPQGDARKQAWRIRSAADTPDEMVDLVFTPWGAREDHTNLGVVVSDFVQPYGTFSGTVRVFSYSIGRVLSMTLGPQAFGVVEDHNAVW